ncbi:MAG: putative bifunctional diguanylate cyclase/phosphodiesterase [Actinomycetes bacterium]
MVGAQGADARRSRRAVDLDLSGLRRRLHWSQLLLGALLGFALGGLVLHAVDAELDSDQVSAAITQLEADSGALIAVQDRSLVVYEAVDSWEEGGPFSTVEAALVDLDAELGATTAAGTPVRSLVGEQFLANLEALRSTVASAASDPAAAYEPAETFERSAVQLSRRYEQLLNPQNRVDILGSANHDERGVQLVVLVVALVLLLGAVTVARSRSNYRAATERFERDREELARASVLELGEAEILAGIVEGSDVEHLVVDVLDLAHRLTGGSYRFLSDRTSGVSQLPPLVVGSVGGTAHRGARSLPPVAAARWLVGASGGLELGVLELEATEPAELLSDRDRAVARRCADLIALVIDRALAEEQLRFRASHDSLTGMPNRERLLEVVADALADGSTGAGDVALIFCDLDRFKLVNDTLGHRTGDELLRAVGGRLHAAAERTGATVFRLGGDEFVAVCTGPGAAARAASQAQEMAECLRERFMVGGSELFVAASFGVAVADAATTPEQLLRNADIAMYAAKGDPLTSVALFGEDLEAGRAAQFEIDTALRSALAEDQLTVHFQPIVDVESSRAVGVEALVRWERAGAFMPPNEFLPVARAHGLMGELGRVVMGKALDAVGAVIDQVPDLTVWLNIDRMQLFDSGFVAALDEALARTGVPAGNVVLEVSEADLLHVDEISGAISELRSRGVRLAMDDFGTGYSSIVRLTALPVDVVKLDRALVAGLAEGGSRAESILAASVTLVSGAGLDVVVEGVETEAELQVVRWLGCRTVQGYLLRRPGPMDEVLAECVQAAPAATA